VWQVSPVERVATTGGAPLRARWWPLLLVVGLVVLLAAGHLPRSAAVQRPAADLTQTAGVWSGWRMFTEPQDGRHLVVVVAFTDGTRSAWQPAGARWSRTPHVGTGEAAVVDSVRRQLELAGPSAQLTLAVGTLLARIQQDTGRQPAAADLVVVDASGARERIARFSVDDDPQRWP